MEWIDDFGRQLILNENMNDTEKKNLLSRILKDIIVTYDSKEKLHHLSINFKLPILTDIIDISNKNAGILDLKSSTKKRTKMAESFTRKGDQNAPNGDYSTVTDFARFLGWSTLHPRIIAIW